MLEVVVISLSSRDYPAINQTGKFGTIHVDERMFGATPASPLGVITAEKWFKEGGRNVLASILAEPNAIQTVELEANKPRDVPVRSGGWNPFGNGGGTLVLANFNGLGSDKSIQSDVWIPGGGKAVVEVDEKAIRRRP
jgi:hypothetical protein